jgi:hypothetical protein
METTKSKPEDAIAATTSQACVVIRDSNIGKEMKPEEILALVLFVPPAES